ncbi:hypothetical protein LOD99_7336 [Oopsacas minuta]|uniref:Uncharacterized protein n=1 Tax=Oopsacas minuta TaxID=111878 RepID=A0AAV7JUJ6_9METZ|nr:hypothetical protein LOD99_7336 [Oopsacas minuta]
MPSALDIDAVSCSVLNDIQHKAVDYVLCESKKSSDLIYPYLKCRVRHLGYTNTDLDKTLHWIRYEAPIIIHLNLDTALNFLVKDTHYRNRFETGTSGGCLDLAARSSWEDRIFDKAYRKSPASYRVKYGVLNIVGDSCGVKACYGYGDSFLQLKKVRLRTTFASADTSMSNVKLSCCEHYVNVMNEYSESELKAILDVATKRVSSHDSSVIATYKEVQIHGPVSLSDNVECIVVNQRHRTDKKINKLLEKFITDNKCNLIWMDEV